MDGGMINPEQAPSELPEASGIYPKPNEIALQGRDNADLVFKPREVLLRAGKFELNNNLKFNKIDPAYIQLKYNVPIKAASGNIEEERGSVTNIVSSKINLLTHKDGNPRFTLNNQEEMITDNELLRILDEAHDAAFGDVLVEWAKLIQEFVSTHIHPYNGIPSDQNKNVRDILNFDVERLKSKNIKLN
jgi:hypothetical protein